MSVKDSISKEDHSAIYATTLLSVLDNLEFRLRNKEMSQDEYNQRVYNVTTKLYALGYNSVLEAKELLN